MIKVGMILSLRGAWQGGVNYYKNLWNCYQKHPDPEVKLAVFTPYPEDLVRYRCDAIEVHFWPGVPRRDVWTLPGRVSNRLFGFDAVLLGLVKGYRINLLSHLGWLENDALGKWARIPVLPWMPDFQHRRLPKFFTAEECADRDSYVARSRQCGHLLLSSQSAEADFRRFYPELEPVQTHILRFSCASIVDMDPLSREELGTRYPVHDPYFFLPNQFWQHKNHAVVVEALRQTPPEIRVICTGPMEDRRDPGYVPGLLEKVKQAGLEERFVCLGTVPYLTLVSLMHHSLAVVQPSLFEGWSTTVEESKAMRKRIILSNIDVHLEQAPERGEYFSPESPEQLASCLKRAHAEFDPATEESFVNQRQQNKARVEREWMEQYARIVKNVAKARN